MSSHQWLFNTQAGSTNLPGVCLRHDVDGLIWQPVARQPQPSECPWEHVATFNAFGYVQASKQQKKFSTCPSDFSYVAISDCVKHIYIYRQPSAILSPIRNRKTGREVASIAKQQLISLESTADIVGLQAAGSRLVILAGQTLYVVQIQE